VFTHYCQRGKYFAEAIVSWDECLCEDLLKEWNEIVKDLIATNVSLKDTLIFWKSVPRSKPVTDFL